MPLTLRPTGLRQSAAFAHLADYSAGMAAVARLERSEA
jgi:hypothetical protein